MRIAQLRLSNWLCFKGEHEIELGPKVYAVVARLNSDADRSNYLGKSSLLEAVDFALYGRHRKRTEDEWITDGEKVGEVELVLDDGTRIVRSRARGKRTSLFFNTAAMQEEAQHKINAMLGLTSEDFLATCYFQQRQMARLVLAKPDERMGIISGWLRLGPLEQCEDKVRTEVKLRVDRLAQLSGFRQALEERMKSAELSVGDMVVLEDHTSQRRSQVGELQDDIAVNLATIAAKAKVEDFERLCAEGIRLKEELAIKGDAEKLTAEADVTVKTHAESSAMRADLHRQLQERRSLARGKFDGHCPVMQAECPAKEQVQKACRANQGLLEDAEKAYAVALEHEQFAAQVANKARAKAQEVERLAIKLDQMRSHAARMLPEVEQAREMGEPQDQHVLRQRLDAAQERLQAAVLEHDVARRAQADLDDVKGKLEAIGAEVTRYQAELAVYREALVIFGKQGAQRRVAEGALADIEEGANDMLRGCGTDLSVEVRWSREGTGWAKACDACGHPFPSSVKVKECTRCGAARGPLLVNKLDLALSNRSGAAEDLVGAALQLSASAWLRRERGSSWSLAMLDEPFGQCDRTLRRAFGAHITSMLSRNYGFSQALVVAHSPDVLDALPGRIEIVSDGKYSSLRVIA